MKAILRILPFAAASAALLVTGCGDSSRSAEVPASAPATTTSAAAQPTEGRPVVIIANDAMKFDVTTIRARPGEAIAVTLRNEGTMPKFSMGHNWVLLDANVDVNAFVGDAAQAAKTDYLPAAYRDQILAATRLLGPKEQDTVIFTAPTRPGRYVYVCSFPGHLQVGMKGELVVE